MSDTPSAPPPEHNTEVQTERVSQGALFRIFLRLGVTSFGGPVAHIGYFREEFVARRKWLDESRFADLVALCQFLPGPASSQVGVALGALRGGLLGALLAWAAFTLPSALLLLLFASGLNLMGTALPTGLLQGLKAVAVAVVAQAVWGMAKSLCPDRPRATIALLAAMVLVLLPGFLGQFGVILLGGLAGWRLYRGMDDTPPGTDTHMQPTWRGANAYLAAFFVLLAALPLAAAAFGGQTLALLDTFYRVGSLVFGGGHVVLPLLQAEVVPPGWIGQEAFLAGYGAAQAVPGPLFSFSAYLGAMIEGGAGPRAWLTGLWCLVAMYLPTFLLVFGVLPHWNTLRQFRAVRAALLGVNAAVVGLLLAALYHPVFTAGVQRPAHLALVLAAFLALAQWKVPPWLVVLCCAVVGAVLL